MSTRDDQNAAPLNAPRRLWLRIVVGVVLALIVLFAIVLWMLTHLEHPWVKKRVEGALSAAVGTVVSYERLSISPFSGLELEGLVLETPENLRVHAEEMFRIDRLDVPLELKPLLSGNIVLPEVEGGAAALTIVVTDDGRNSFGELPSSEAAEEPADEPGAPFSESLNALEAIPLEIGPIRLAPIRARVVEVVEGAVESETHLQSLAISSDGISLGSSLGGSLRVEPGEGDEVVVSVVDQREAGKEPHERRARLVPALEANLEGDGALSLLLRLGLVEQTLFPQLSEVSVLLDLESSAAFRPDEARTTVDVSELTVFDSMLVAAGRATIDDDFSARVNGNGTVKVATLPWVLPWLLVDDLTANLEVKELEVESGEVTSGDAKVTGSVSRLTYDDDDGSLVAVRDAEFDASLSAPEGATRTLGLLEVAAFIDEFQSAERGAYRATVRGLDAKALVRGVGADDRGMWGLHGNGAVDGSLRGVMVDAGMRVRGRNASLDLDIDLGSRQVNGRIPVEVLVFRHSGFDPVELRRAELQVAADEPIRWTEDEGSPAVDVDASVARVSTDGKHFRAKDWTFRLERTGVDVYSLDSRIAADRVSWGKFEQDRESVLAVDAVLDATRPAVSANAALSIAGRSETAFRLNASHDAPVTRYDLEMVGTHAGPILGALLFDDGGKEDDELDFRLESRGDFRGLFRRAPDGSLRLSREPLRTMRGDHASTLRIERAALSRNGILHELQGLTVTAKSTHESPGRGQLEAGASFDQVRYGEAGWELSAREYEHALSASYAALYGAPSFAVRTSGQVGEVLQPYFRQYPVRDAVFGAQVDIAESQVFAIREAYFRNPAGGTKFEARAAYEGWQDVRDAEVCVVGTEGCPRVMSMYGRRAAMVTGTFEQDFGFWKSTERTKSGGSFVMPFTVETGDLNTYRVLAAAEFRDVVLELPQYGLLVDDLDALIPVEQELATNPRFFIVPTKKANAMAQKRFFDLYPFTKRDSFFSVDEIQFGRERVGPLAANVQVVGSTLAVEQLHAAYRNGFVTGQILGDLSVEDPKFVFRGNVTGIEATDGKGVLDANVAMTFVPTTLILEGKAQVVRISKDHLYELIDVIDPYHEDEDLNRVRLALKFGYPKFVVLKLDEGLMDAKIDLGGLAGAVRIDEIKGIPVTPFIEQYIQPYLERVLSPTAAARAMIMENEGT